jgi:uncharacterized membrane protein YdjX (TVP38/TMEM64 family)
MKLAVSILMIAIILAVLFFLTFMWWGETFESLFNQKACAEWLTRIRPIGWLIGILLLISDIFLPVPATGVMSALGDVYGFWPGWIFGAIGSLSAGLLGYGLARLLGNRISPWLAGEDDLKRFQWLFDRWGGGAIIVSRILPILPEVMTVLAGLAKMRFHHFSVALLLGTLPVTALFSWWGDSAAASSHAAVHTAAVLFPVLLWPLVLLLLNHTGRNNDPPSFQSST